MCASQSGGVSLAHSEGAPHAPSEGVPHAPIEGVPPVSIKGVPHAEELKPGCTTNKSLDVPWFNSTYTDSISACRVERTKIVSRSTASQPTTFDYINMKYIWGPHGKPYVDPTFLNNTEICKKRTH